MIKSSWSVESYIETIRKMEKPNVEQRIFVLLHDKNDRSPDEERDYKTLIRAAKAEYNLAKSKERLERAKNKTKDIVKKEDKARTHELIKSAGLLIMAGLVDSKTGKPTWDKGELLGALSSMASVEINDAKRQSWKAKGDSMLAEKK